MGWPLEPFSSIIWGNPRTLGTPQRGFMVAPPEEWAKHETRGDNDRITTSLELRYNPVAWSTHRVAVGLDRSEANDWVLIPRQPEGRSHFWGRRALGVKQIERVTNRFITVDGKIDASSTGDMPTQVMLGHLPLLAGSEGGDGKEGSPEKKCSGLTHKNSLRR